MDVLPAAPPPPAARAGGKTSQRWLPWLPVLVALALSTAISVLALSTASGVTYLGDSSYDTEFVSGWWGLAWFLPLLPGVTAWFRPLVAAWQGLAVAGPQVVTAAIVVNRYRVSDWGDGLEFLSFLMPLGLVAVSAVLIAAALIFSPRSRAARRA